ncbi:MAG: bifunctional [glutamate--ammonia ligase]-adenylyl-L-tyrosine phosphorylase/[glutamate--ammonia-ligase] adenylyltransferase [Pseudomonadota bacterium]
MWVEIETALRVHPWFEHNPETQETLGHWFSRLAEVSTSAAEALHRVALEQNGDWWRAAAASAFVRDAACQEPEVIESILAWTNTQPLFDPEHLAHQVSTHGSERGLRRFRRQFALAVAWLDLAGRASLAMVLRALSDFADAAIEIAVATAQDRLESRYGVLRDSSGEPVPLRVLCMGKLGGRELNFSSDIDLIFVYPSDGESDGRRCLQAEEYCLRQARLVIDILDRSTECGRVFRVDTRLRPFGSAGPLAMSIDALEVYLQRHGRAWERYAFVKARLPGERRSSPTQDWVEDCLMRFVYRAYLDFSVLGALREMQQKIEDEAATRDAATDVKRGPGGIREIEFIVQSWQLIRGGRAVQLRTPSLYDALAGIVELGGIAASDAQRLRAAYDYLRVLENRLQALTDRQTHRLPTDLDEQRDLCLAMNVTDWPTLMTTLDSHRAFVSAAFRGLVFAGNPEGGAEPQEMDWLSADTAVTAARLADYDLPQPRELAETIRRFAERIDRQPLTVEVRQRVQRAVDGVVARIGGFPPPDAVLERALALIEAVCRRSAYLALLNEQPQAFDRLLRLLSSSQFVADQILEQPMLLDELLDARLFSEPRNAAQMRTELERVQTEVGVSDAETITAAMVRFVRTAHFRIAVADVSGLLPIMRVSDRLSDTATLVLEQTLALAWDELVARHGTPGGLRPGCTGFAVVGYGKLGGLEMGYGSDLDVVFLHDLPDGETTGEAALDHSVFVMRLARRIVHLLSVQTGHGSLYEVDMRLRPSGRSGLLVSSVSAFARYQQKDAWTWEHQALVRARAVAGDPAVMRQFDQIRRSTLAECVNRDSLRVAVADMRRRMRQELSRSGPNEFDLKQDPGGIADIEFLVQYLVLAHADRFADLLDWTDNIRQLDSLAANGVVSESTAHSLQDAYTALRAATHALALNRARPIVGNQRFQEERRFASHQWQQWLGAH